ncbi:MAG: caspase family protein [Magnetococcales bacterium]|nr:caspase family protein [Magnetococcales bacterium]
MKFNPNTVRLLLVIFVIFGLQACGGGPAPKLARQGPGSQHNFEVETYFDTGSKHLDDGNYKEAQKWFSKANRLGYPTPREYSSKLNRLKQAEIQKNRQFAKESFRETRNTIGKQTEVSHDFVDHCIIGDCENGQGTYKYANGDQYIGGFINGNENGYGTYKNANGITVKSGLWKDGEFIGKAQNDKKIIVSQEYKKPFAKASSATDNINFGNYHALVIGINQYQHLPNLKTAVNDARTVATLLQNEFGFKVKRLENSSRKSILTALNNYRNKLGSQDNLLIYYAGHGLVDKGKDSGYWLPSEAVQGNDVDWIPLDQITSTLRAIEAKHIMVVSDSCYSGKLTRGLKVVHKTPSYYEKMAKTKARVVMTSGGLEPVEDGSGEHSVFAKAFLRSLSESPKVIDGMDLFSQIRERVMLDADQKPEYSNIRKTGHDGGDFLFVRQ